MVHFLYQISTFSYFEGWGTCLAVQPASRMLLAGLWLLPDSGWEGACAAGSLLLPDSGCILLLLIVLLHALECSSGRGWYRYGGGVLYWFALLDDVGRRIFVAGGVGGFSQDLSADFHGRRP